MDVLNTGPALDLDSQNKIYRKSFHGTLQLQQHVTASPKRQSGLGVCDLHLPLSIGPPRPTTPWVGCSDSWGSPMRLLQHSHHALNYNNLVANARFVLIPNPWSCSLLSHPISLALLSNRRRPTLRVRERRLDRVSNSCLAGS